MRDRREDGTVLLNTLLVLSLMSAVALLLLSTVRSAITRTIDLDARAQANLYAQGARDFARSQLDQIATLDPVALNQFVLQAGTNVLPFDNGSITITVSDGSHCLRLSALTNDAGLALEPAQNRLAALMTAVGIDQNRSTRLAAATVDWVDADSQTRPGGAEDGVYLSRPDSEGGPHRTANVPMQSIVELRSVQDMDEATFRILLPYLCLGDQGVPTRFNIDTALPRHAPVLAAILGGGREADRVALDLIERRPAGGYGTMDQLAAAPALDGYDNPAQQRDLIQFSPDRIVAETIIRFGTVEQAQLLAYEGLDKRRPTLSYQAWGWDEFPSLAWASLDIEATQEATSP